MNDKQTGSFIFHRKTDSCFPLHPGRTAGSRRRLLLLTLILGLLQAGAGEYQAAEDSGGKADGSPEVYQTLYMDGNLFKELTNRISDTGLYVGSFSSCGQSAPLYIHKDGGDGLENIWAAENNGAVGVPGVRLRKADVMATRQKAAWWARAVCDSPWHGYDVGSGYRNASWGSRYGQAKRKAPGTGDYCCSSLPLCAYYFAGVNLIGEGLGGPDPVYIPHTTLPFYTNQISYYYNGQLYVSGTNSYNLNNFLNLFGFTDVTDRYLADRKNFRFLTGDIVVLPNHCELVLSDGNRKTAQIAQSHGADKKHRGGDQSGTELEVAEGIYGYKKIRHIFRFTGQGVALNTVGLSR